MYATIVISTTSYILILNIILIKPLKKLLHEAFQEAYDSYLKLEDYCQTYGLGFYFEETKKLPAPHTVLENYFQNLKECFNQGKYFSNEV